VFKGQSDEEIGCAPDHSDGEKQKQGST
jgi:hypothetical protein